MKLLYGDLNLVLEFHENEVQLVISERPETFSKIVYDFQQQIQGKDSRIILSKDNQILAMEQQAELIVNPFDIEMNKRKILGKLYQEMKEISDEDYYVEAGKVHTEIVRYLDNISLKLPYPIRFNTEMNVLNLFKLYDLRLEEEQESLLQRMIDYLKLLCLLCGVKLLILVNIKNYFNEFQLMELYKTAFYYKIDLLLIEAVQRDGLQHEHTIVFDRHDCVIEF